mmetsp:Transcript_116775/g.183634  ORF Transcript_116775/g.183634 Transcript_116775/m.183634 type:complete len:602 (+) Transcript_116775:59-1864(+)|eukprot:CAMPEP_0169085456 /NCGR_PEP_ID=MMETSP1015-20121227/13170_1 /TAXON_ID=342587 /ORGANISM="Karlodinium micrum, Strain CCMP2283" /LENGTH=601 /DNA_ID=CAMNT_0009145545 /DNA_START=24 /DNA_END=1829 /DNA_ORIENTATION=-
MAREDVVDGVATLNATNARNGKTLDSEQAGEENLQEDLRETGLKGLPAEEKARIGQLIKLLAQERRDKNVYRQKLDEQTARLQTLEQEYQSGTEVRREKEAYRKKVDEQNTRLQVLQQQCEIGEKARLDNEALRQKIDEQNARLQTLEKECELVAKERHEKEVYRKKLDEQNVRLDALEKECAMGRQQEQDLLSRVSRSLHLLRSYQRELSILKDAARCENKKSEIEQSAMSKDGIRIVEDGHINSAPSASTKEGSASRYTADYPKHDESQRVQVAVQTSPWHVDPPKGSDVSGVSIAQALQTTSTTEKGSLSLVCKQVQASVQTSPLRKSPVASSNDPSDNVFTFGRLSQQHDARIRSRSPSAFRNTLSQFHSPRQPPEPVQSLSPLPRAAASRSSSMSRLQHQTTAHKLEPSAQSSPSRQLPPRPCSPSHSPKPQQKPLVHSIWPLPLATLSTTSYEQIPHSLEQLERSPDLPRIRRSERVSPSRSSWPAVIQDGYYPPSMFDVLDSVESALSKGSSTNVQTPSFGTSSSELARLQQEIAALEFQVYGASIAAPAGNSIRTNFHDLIDGIGISTTPVISTEALARGKGRGKAFTKPMPA